MHISRPIAFCSVLGSVLLVSFSALALRPVFAAKSLRNDLRSIPPGTFPAERLRRWAEASGGSATCAGDRCEANVEVANGLLRIVHLAPPTEFRASVTTVGGQVTQTSLTLSDVQYSENGHSGASTLLIVDYAASKTPGPEAKAPRVAAGPTGKPPARVYVVSRSDAHDLTLAYEINVWCLARIGGCRPDKQAPEIWSLAISPPIRERQ